MRSSLIALLLTASVLLPAFAFAGSASVHGHIVDATGLPLPGVALTLHARGVDSSLTTTTTSDGAFTIDDVPPGHYDIDAALDGFQRGTRSDIDVSAEASVTVDMQLSLAAVQQQLTVSAPAPADLSPSSEPDAPVTVTREVMDVAMLPNSQFDDVLPLMPNVVRAPDGAISVAGARPAASGLFVNGLNASDPIAGGAGLMLPLEAVDSIQVYSGGAPASLGQATGGITAVRTRSGGAQFHTSVDSFLPRLLYSDSGVRGVAFWDPNAGISGPMGSRVTFQQAVSYRYDRNSFTTLAGDDHNVFDALLSWTQIDATLSPAQHLRVSFAADPRHTDHVSVTAFTPSSSAPAVGEGGWTAGLTDAIVAGRALLELHASVLRSTVDVEPSGDTLYSIGHDLASGTYFDRQDRRALVGDIGATLTRPLTSRMVVAAGITIAKRQLAQAVSGGTVDMLRSDNTVARTVTFLHPLPANVVSNAIGLFAQDEWTPRSWLNVNAGLRYDAVSGADDAAPSPRIGWSMSRDHGRTKVSGSAGWFADALPLGALAFPALPARAIATANAESAVDTVVSNVFGSVLRAPQAFRWDLELNRTRGPWTTRVRYEERHGVDELVVDAPIPDGTASVAELSSTGSSRARSLELTGGFRSVSGNEAFLSVVHASTWGDCNSLDAIEGILRAPFVQPDARGPLPMDVPNRVLLWGVFQLPGRFTIAPFLDTRNGFPFTVIDDQWVRIGAPGSRRLPWMSSLDLSATRVVALPHGLPDARVGLKLYNIVSAHTEREVQRDIDRLDFGTTYDPVPRDFSFVFELLWGRRRQPSAD